MHSDTDVVIIGGGAIGICSAYYLWKLGARVTVVEKGEIGSGCSFGNAGLVVPSHFIPLAAPGVITKAIKWMFNPESPFYIKPRLDPELVAWVWRFRAACSQKHLRRSMPLLRDLALESVDLYQELANIDGMDFGFERKGLINLHNSEKGRREDLLMAELAHELGVEASILDNDQVNQLDPNLRSHAQGGVYFPQDTHLSPSDFVCNLSKYLQSKGVKMYTSTEVKGFDRSNGSLSAVRTSNGAFSAKEIVLATGSWSPGILKEVGLRLPVQPAKGYSITLVQPKRKPSLPLILTESKVAITPMRGNLRFGGTLELAGLDLSINLRRVHAIIKAVPRYLSGFDTEEMYKIKPWAGLRPCTPDGLPFLGRVTSCPNLIVATGHAMVGISLATASGKLVSEIAMGKTPSHDVRLLSVDRYS